MAPASKAYPLIHISEPRNFSVSSVENQSWSILKHSHLHEQITLILEGEMEMVIGGEKYLLTAGATHAIPSYTPHSAYAVTDCKVIDSFAPARDDYR